MLDLDGLRSVLSSPELRAAHGLELPAASLETLSRDPAQLAAFHERWTAAGQPRYEPPAVPQAVAPEPTEPSATASAAPPGPAPAAAAAPAPPPPPAAPLSPDDPGRSSAAAPPHHGWTWTSEFKPVDIQEVSSGFGFGNGPQATTPAELLEQLPPEQQEQLREALRAAEQQLPIVRTLLRPGLVAMVAGFVIVLVALAVILLVVASRGPAFLVAAPAVIGVFGLVGGIRGLVRLVGSSAG